MDGRDNRWSSRRSRVGKHFRGGKHPPRTRKDWQKPRQRPAEDFKGRGRAQNKQTAEETIEIIDEGGYEYIYDSDDEHDSDNESVLVPLQADLKYARDNTVTYTSEQSQALTKFNEVVISEGMDDSAAAAAAAASTKEEVEDTTIYEIHKETTLVGCKSLVDEGYNVLALNFASARNPGGGFLKGSNAQEESLARASGLYHCIHDSEMYGVNEQRAYQTKYMYTHMMIYSPNVPVFRDDQDELILQPYKISFVTAPAVNATEASKRSVGLETLNKVMTARIDRILGIAKHYGHDALVLGSYGCGVFGNSIQDVGEIFCELLTGKYAGSFKKVVFSVLGDHDYDTLTTIFE